MSKHFVETEWIEHFINAIELAGRLRSSEPEIFTEPQVAARVWAQVQADENRARRLLEDLELLGLDESAWLACYLRLIGESRDAMPGIRRLGGIFSPLRRLLPDYVPCWERFAARRAVFVQCRNALRLAREYAEKRGVPFRSMVLERELGLELDEIDILLLLLHHNLTDGHSVEGRSILHFISRDEEDIIRKIPLLIEGKLRENDFIRPHGLIPRGENVLLQEFMLTPEGLHVFVPPGEEMALSAELHVERQQDCEMTPLLPVSAPRLGTLREPRVSLEDVVLPAEVRDQVKALLLVVREERELDGLLANALFDRGRGCVILLYGEPGTGKTLLAEAIAHELGRELLSADWASLGSAYWWETEKRLGKVFKEAVDNNAVLLLDEIDMLNARCEGVQSGQQHINRLVNILLMRLEESPPGSVIIMATNRAEALDPAIDRRLTLKLEMLPAQTEEERSFLWRVHLRTVPMDMELEEVCGNLARQFPELNHGGHIKQVVMAAVRRTVLRCSEGPLEQNTLQQEAESIIKQLGLKRKQRMGFRV